MQAIFKKTPHDKQVMMFSATLSSDIRPVCKKFMRDVRPRRASPGAAAAGPAPAAAAACSADGRDREGGRPVVSPALRRARRACCQPRPWWQQLQQQREQQWWWQHLCCQQQMLARPAQSGVSSGQQH